MVVWVGTVRDVVEDAVTVPGLPVMVSVSVLLNFGLGAKQQLTRRASLNEFESIAISVECVRRGVDQCDLTEATSCDSKIVPGYRKAQLAGRHIASN